MENTECLVRGRLAGIGPVTAGALKASHPKPGLTATCWAKPTLLLSKPSLWKINVPNKTWSPCQIFIVFKVQIQERKRCPREIRCGKIVYLSAAISWRGRGHRKRGGRSGGKGGGRQRIQLGKKKKKAWSISNCLCETVPYRPAADSGVPCAPVWQWWWSRCLVVHPRLCCTATEGGTGRKKYRETEREVLVEKYWNATDATGGYSSGGKSKVDWLSTKLSTFLAFPHKYLSLYQTSKRINTLDISKCCKQNSHISKKKYKISFWLSQKIMSLVNLLN